LFLEIVKTEKIKAKGEEFMAYIIKGRDTIGNINVPRRYSDFFFLRDILKQRYPGMMIPPIPPKRMKGKSNEVVKKRHKHLNQFLKELASWKYLSASPELQMFLRPP
jgi:hypothetical protein